MMSKMMMEWEFIFTVQYLSGTLSSALYVFFNFIELVLREMKVITQWS